MMAFDSSLVGASVAYDEQRGNAGATDGLTTPSQKHIRTSIGGYLFFGPVRLGAGWYGQKIDAVVGQTINIYYGGATWHPVPTIELAGQMARQIVERTNNATLYIARLEYSMSLRTALYVMYAYMNNSSKSTVPFAGSTVGPGLNSQGILVGMRQSF